MPPTSRPDLAQIKALLGSVKDHGQVKAALGFVEALLPGTGAQLRELVERAPQMAEAVADQARENLTAEARTLDRAIARSVSGVFDELLTAGGGRTPKEKRLRAGSKSRAAEAARRGRSRR